MAVAALPLWLTPLLLWGAPLDELSPPDLAPLEAESPATKLPATPKQPTAPTMPELRDARNAFTANDVPRCLELLRAAVAKEPTLSPPKVALARLFLNAGQHASARAVLEQFAEENPDHAEIFLELGHLALFDGHVTDAWLNFDKALSVPLPTNWPNEKVQQLRAECYLGQVEVAQRRGHWHQMQQLLEKLVEMNPRNAKLRDRWGWALFKAGHVEAAFEQFDIAFQQDRAVNPPEVSMGVRYVAAGKFDEANRWFRTALAKYPTDAGVLLEFSGALLTQGHLELAEKYAAKAAELGLDSLTLHVQRAQVAFQRDDHSTAERILNEALKKKPNSTTAKSLLALVLVESSAEDKRSEALRIARDIVADRPQNPVAQARLAWIYFRLGQLDEAGRGAQAALTSGATPETLFFATRILMETSDREKAAHLAEQLAARLTEPGTFFHRQASRTWLANTLAP